MTLEAQAAGTPVLAFSIGGIREQISLETGWLVNEISANALQKEIEKIFHDENWMADVAHRGKMARKRCEQLYDEKNMAKRYEKIYNEKNIYATDKKFGKG